MPRNNITNIHDKFIKQILSNKELAVEFLQQYLPEPLNSILDFETLNQQDTSYITDELKTSYSDLIWGVQMKGKESLQISLLSAGSSIRANLCIQKRITDQCGYVAEVLF